MRTFHHAKYRQIWWEDLFAAGSADGRRQSPHVTEGIDTFRCNSRLRGRVTVMAAKDVPPDTLRVTYKVTMEIEGGKRPTCVEVIGQHYR